MRDSRNGGDGRGRAGEDARADGDKRSSAQRERGRRRAARPERREASERSGEPESRRTRVRRVVTRVVVAALIVVLAVAVFFIARHTMHRDDPNRILGTWQIESAHMTVVIDGERIRMPDNVDFSYTIDPDATALTFHNGDRSGKAAYRLYDDGATLVLTEQVPTSSVDDQGETVENTTERQLLLTRVSYDTTTQPAYLDQ